MKSKIKTFLFAVAMVSFSLTAFAGSTLYTASQHNVNIDSFEELVLFSLIKSKTI